jgi:membrane-associated HD superfamily phosphohydrolase
MRDVQAIRQTFISALKGVYHPRIKYPQPSLQRVRESEI